MIDFIKLSDGDLAAFLSEGKREAGRRSLAATEDAAKIIRGQEMAKRATLVAVAGGFSITYLGPPASGKTMLRALALSLGVLESYEFRPCPCGYATDPRRACECDEATIAEHLKGLPPADIFIEVSPVPQREMESKLRGTGVWEIEDQIEKMSPKTGLPIEGCASSLLKSAINDLGLSPASRETVLKVAEVIARLDGCATIAPSHIAESVNYHPRWSYIKGTK